MYKIYVGNTCIFNDKVPVTHNDSDDIEYIINPRLSMEENSAGELTFSISDKATSLVNRLRNPTNEVRVVRTDLRDANDNQFEEEIWRGRFLSYARDFFRYINFTFEGQLAYLNDVILTQQRYVNQTIEAFIRSVITRYNSSVPASRRFTIGTISIDDRRTSTVRYTDYETALDALQTNVIDTYKDSHVSVTYANGTRTINVFEGYPGSVVQTANFGENLLDYTESFETTDFASVVIPLGASLSTPEVTGLTAYTTVKSVNSNSIYVVDNDLVSEYGRIEKVLRYDEIDSPTALLNTARKYLNETQFSELKIEASIVDLAYMGVDQSAPLTIYSKVKVKSDFHGLSTNYPVTKLEIALDDPTATKVTLGKTRRGQTVSDFVKKNSKKKSK